MQIVPLVAAALLLTVGLAMFLSGTENGADLVQPAIVVFGGTLVALLVTFPLNQIGVAMQVAVHRGIRGGSSPVETIRAMMRVCDISRRDGLQGVGEIRTNYDALEDACYLISQAAEEQKIQFQLDRQRSAEHCYHRLVSDVFLFTALYALLIGGLGSVIRFVTSTSGAVSMPILPFVCGATLALLLFILLGRLRTAHSRELISIDIAYQGAVILLEDNNVQRLQSRLTLLLPHGMR